VDSPAAERSAGFFICAYWRFHRFGTEWLGSTKIHLKGIEETRKSPHRQDSGLFHALSAAFLTWLDEPYAPVFQRK
jgi:hypothetical protein